MPPAATDKNPRQAITGLMPPSLGEARVRVAFPALPGVAAAPAGLAKMLTRTYVLVPLAWLIQAPLFALKFAPFVCKRYTLTNRRLMVRKGWKPVPVQEIALADIEDARLDREAVDPFFVSGTLQVFSKGQVAMTLPGVPEPEGFRQTVLNTIAAWVPGKNVAPFQPASAVKSETPAKK
jgi:hypothetical protein